MNIPSYPGQAALEPYPPLPSITTMLTPLPLKRKADQISGLFHKEVMHTAPLPNSKRKRLLKRAKILFPNFEQISLPPVLLPNNFEYNNFPPMLSLKIYIKVPLLNLQLPRKAFNYQMQHSVVQTYTIPVKAQEQITPVVPKNVAYDALL